jgi:hypothetical protein
LVSLVAYESPEGSLARIQGREGVYLKFRVTRKRLVLLMVAGALLTAGGVAYATIPDGAGVYTACKLNALGTIRLIDPTATPASSLLNHCTTFETQITWNQQGQPGTKGDVGPKGDTGLQGLKGDTGATGSAGLKGDKGDTGATGLKGDTGTQGPAGEGFAFQGGYDPTTTYLRNDVAVHNGTAYVARYTTTSTPGTDNSWVVFAAAGAQGPQGIQGPKGDTGSQGIQGLKGDKGDTGPAGGSTILWALMNADGTAKAHQGAIGVSLIGGQVYEITFNRNVTSCAIVATAQGNFTADAAAGGGTNNGNSVYVELFHGYDLLSHASYQTGAFSVTVFC